MTRLVLALVVALAIAAPVASAGAPYRLSHPAATTAALSKQFVAVARKRLGGKQWHVNSIACTKGGVGRVYCAVVATSPSGTSPYEFGLICANDVPTGCTAYVEQWTAKT
jgi:hypothetical protein